MSGTARCRRPLPLLRVLRWSANPWEPYGMCMHLHRAVRSCRALPAAWAGALGRSRGGSEPGAGSGAQWGSAAGRLAGLQCCQEQPRIMEMEAPRLLGSARKE